MTKLQRINSAISGLGLGALSVMLAVIGESAYHYIVVIVALSMICTGLSKLYYYFSMARYMVGGKQVLMTGIILVDLGSFSGTLMDNSMIYIVLYLLVIHAFSGIFSVLLALERKKLDAPSWRLKFSQGVINILIAVTSIVFLHSTEVVVLLYSFGLLSMGIEHIANSVRKTAVVYIQ